MLVALQLARPTLGNLGVHPLVDHVAKGQVLIRKGGIHAKTLAAARSGVWRRGPV